MSQNCRQKGRNANKHSHIGRHGIGQSNIFQQKIEINAAKACRRKNNFLLEIDVFCSVGIEQKLNAPAHHKTEKENFHRQKIIKQNFGGNKGRAPDKDSKKCSEMP